MWEGAGKVEALLASSMLADEGRDPSRISALGPSGLPSVTLEASLNEEERVASWRPSMVGCLISWKGQLDGKRPGTPA